MSRTRSCRLATRGDRNVLFVSRGYRGERIAKSWRASKPGENGFPSVALATKTTRALFPAGEPKRPYLADVLFSGGIIRLADGQADLYTGVSDCEAHQITIPDPFLEYESV